MRRLFHFSFPILAVAISFGGNTSQKALKDFTSVDPKTLGVTPFASEKDEKTGFMVGGKNATELIAKLPSIAGRSIKALEKDMRPGALSTKGFLGKDESLLEILAGDNRFVVDTKGLTHQLLAKHLHIVGAIAEKNSKDEPFDFLYHGRKYKVSAIRFRGFVESPFEDGTKTNVAVNITNATNDKTISTSLIVPHLIERYGFYEGKGTPYRLEPASILEVFDFLTTEKKP